MKNSKAFNSDQNNNSSAMSSRNVFVGNTYESNQKQIKSQAAPKTENDAEKKPIKLKKKQDITKLVATVATAITGTAIVTGAGLGGILPMSSIKVHYFETYTSETEITYYAELEEYNPEEDDVYVVLYNDFTNRTQKFEEQMMEGTFENLQPNMTYTIAIKHGNIVIASKVVKTVIQEDEYYDDTGQDEPITEDPTTSDGDGTTGREPNTSDGNEDQGGYTTNG